MAIIDRKISSIKPFQILQNSRRRMVIEVLREVGGTACLREVVRRVATMENGAPPSRSLRKSVYTGIVQNHLPKLTLAGLVEYDRETDALRLIDLPSSYRYHLEAVEKGDVPWCLYYLTLSVVGIFSGLFFAAYTHFWAGSLLTVILSVSLFVSAVFHTARTYGVNGIELIPMGIRAITKRLKQHRNGRKKEE
jgi:hypothetical protein